MSESKIEWTEQTWNPIVGCSVLTPGCTNCYAMKMAARIDQMTLCSHYQGLTEKVNGNVVWTGRIALAPEYIMTAPLRRRKPTTYFVNSMGDLFHENCPDEWIDRVFAVMALTPQHSYQLLTKRAVRMQSYCAEMPINLSTEVLSRAQLDRYGYPKAGPCKWPLPNVWLGVSVERQQEADERVPLLLRTPAAVRFISAEPLLGPINLGRWITSWGGRGGLIEYLDWIIVGGESGHGARPMHPDWARSLRDQCAAADVPFFFKQWGEHGRVSDQRPTPDHLPEDADVMTRVGKKAAGRLLDGVEHNAMPKSPNLSAKPLHSLSTQVGLSQ